MYSLRLSAATVQYGDSVVCPERDVHLTTGKHE